jgi:hypothetical protein
VAVTGASLLALVAVPTGAQQPTPEQPSTEVAAATPALAPTVDLQATVTILRQDVEAQGTEAAQVNRDLELSNREVAIAVHEKDLEDWLPRLLLIALAVGVFLGAIMGAVGTWPWLKTQISNQIDRTISTEISARWERIDPSGIDVYLPNDMGAGNSANQIANLLESLSFRVQWYNQDRLFDDGPIALGPTSDPICVLIFAAKNVVRIDPENRTWWDDTRFVEMIEKYPPNQHSLGYLIFTEGDLRIHPMVAEKYPLVTYANLPTTVGTNLMTLARSLMGHRLKQPDRGAPT